MGQQAEQKIRQIGSQDSAETSKRGDSTVNEMTALRFQTGGGGGGGTHQTFLASLLGNPVVQRQDNWHHRLAKLLDLCDYLLWQ